VGLTRSSLSLSLASTHTPTHTHTHSRLVHTHAGLNPLTPPKRQTQPTLNPPKKTPSPGIKIFDNKILTEASKAPLRAVALASFLGDGFAALGSRAPPPKDHLMAFGAVLHTSQHNIGK